MPIFIKSQFALIAALALSTSLQADTVTARCDIYPKGSDQASSVSHCKFSQRQGHINIVLDSGKEYDFIPDDKQPMLYIDANGKKVTREHTPGDKSLVIYRTSEDSIFVYWDPTIGSADNSVEVSGYKQKLQMQGVTFHLSATNQGSLNNLTIAPVGVEQDDLIKEEIDGSVAGAEIADLDSNGYPEIYVYITSAGSGSYGSLAAFAVNKGISITPIYLPEISVEEQPGYQGHDEFRIDGKSLIRSFPIYQSGDSNAQASGGTRQLEYKLRAGEAGWVLDLVTAKNIASQPKLTNTDWRLIEVVGKDMSRNQALNQAQLQFTEGGKISGSLACNSFNSSYQIEYSTLSIGPFMTTRKACPGDRGEVEAEMNKALAKVNGFQISLGTLHLLIDDMPVLRFAPLRVVTLENKWYLDSISGLSIPDDISPSEVVYMDFKRDGSVSGKTGCNQFSSSYETEAEKLSFGLSAGTMMACPPDFTIIEQAMSKVMADTNSFRIKNNQLELLGTQGGVLASFSQAN